MAFQSGTLDDQGSEGAAHWQMLLLIKTFAEANGWTTLRYDDTADIRELILKSSGAAGVSDTYIGFRSYQDTVADYYNLTAAGFTAYLDGAAFEEQPGYIERAVFAHNVALAYWLVVNERRIVFVLRVGTSVYETCYAGRYLPYALPSQNIYPIMVCGMWTSARPATRYSDTSYDHACGVKGYWYETDSQNNRTAGGVLRNLSGDWIVPATGPWHPPYGSSSYAAGFFLRDTEGQYLARPVDLFSRGTSGEGDAIFGELEGVYSVPGFGNLAENTITIGGVDHLVVPDAFRRGNHDFFLVRLS